MLKVFATQVVISRGFEGAAAIKFSEKGDAVRFRIGKKVYDPNADDNSRWINLGVKGFGAICERIKKMQLKEGSFVNLVGRLEDVWEDSNTHEKKSAMVIILDDIEYASGGGKSKDNQNTDQAANSAPAVPEAAPAAPQAPTNGGFTGYEPFGGNSFFDEN